jgi:hypothetical protein
MRSRPIPKGMLLGRMVLLGIRCWPSDAKHLSGFQSSLWRIAFIRSQIVSNIDHHSKGHKAPPKESCNIISAIPREGIWVHVWTAVEEFRVTSSESYLHIELCHEDSLSGIILSRRHRPVYYLLDCCAKVVYGINCSTSTLLFTEASDCAMSSFGCESAAFLLGWEIWEEFRRIPDSGPFFEPIFPIWFLILIRKWVPAIFLTFRNQFPP